MTASKKTIWITGASSGIGEALAVALSRHGASVVLSARREAELKRITEQSQLLQTKLGEEPLLSDVMVMYDADSDSYLVGFPAPIDLLYNTGGPVAEMAAPAQIQVGAIVFRFTPTTRRCARRAPQLPSSSPTAS